MKYTPLLIVGMSLAACGSVPPPESAPASGPRRDVVGTGVPSIPALLSQRERLALTSPQVIALDSVAREWRIENDTLARRLRGVWGDRQDPRARQGEREREIERARPTLLALVANNRRMTGGVEAILDPAQQLIACELQAAEHDERHAGDARQGRGGARRPSAAGAGRVNWPWCGVARPDTVSAPTR
ncbi:hypothetical protein [Longimicrobium terrae]|uniref:Uncharacterized protein n=1 Tax=Longimicrobium terrae TaxID=1639882 RepID=A0A841GXC3_9BACT|nr:hypothetical protein [Longimicrobium terrae]MBB4635522.1 hypothetical protein [Longimicrobium terrae]MBB6069916.1 hypothetical protein [Longimicrobium terrae]NNC32829.1 hypothetical protein [Longimicrobium terrae]